jgi:hypothetical protein
VVEEVFVKGVSFQRWPSVGGNLSLWLPHHIAAREERLRAGGRIISVIGGMVGFWVGAQPEQARAREGTKVNQGWNHGGYNGGGGHRLPKLY